MKRYILAILGFLFYVNGFAGGEKSSLDINAYLKLAEKDVIYPSQEQLALLRPFIPESRFQPAPSIDDRVYWNSIASGASGKDYLENAISELAKEPEVPITDEIYRRANLEGNRGIYKPRYYRTMVRLEQFILAECIENKGRFLNQIVHYIEAILAMKSWLHPNHDDANNGVLEGRRMTIDLGARRFGTDLALAEVLLKDKLPSNLRSEINAQLQRRIIDSYLTSCKSNDGNNKWIKSTSNWNSVCTSGSAFTTLAVSDNYEERLGVIGSALNSMKYYLSGFGEDGYCSEGAGYWNYGFGHYLYLAQILNDYTDGAINLFEAGNPEKLRNIGNFPKRYRIQYNICAPFSDGSSTADNDGGFAYTMAKKHYGLDMPVVQKPKKSHDSNSATFQLVYWNNVVHEKQTHIDIEEENISHTYFDDFGIVISRGQQETPFSIAIKAGHNAENHNHSDVGSYNIVLGKEIMTGDIGAPSYRAGAFDDDNPARSSWGHPVPRIDNQLQANGIEFYGEITSTSFTQEIDQVEMDIASAYDIPYLNRLTRTMENDKKDQGSIKIIDSFSATRPVTFGIAILTQKDYEIVDDHTVIIQSGGQILEAKVTSVGGEVKIVDELVPLEHLREGSPAYRIGIDFIEPVKEGSISIEFTPKS